MLESFFLHLVGMVRLIREGIDLGLRCKLPYANRPLVVILRSSSLLVKISI